MVVRPARLLPLTATRRPLVPQNKHWSLPRQASGGPQLENIIDSAQHALTVATLNEDGIELSDGLILRGPAIILNSRAFLWEVPQQKWAGWGKETFQIFDVVVPRPEILLFGTGTSTSRPPPSIRQYLSSLGIQLDTMDTRNACSTYNLLLEEGRRVALALLPMGDITSWRSSGQ